MQPLTDFGSGGVHQFPLWLVPRGLPRNVGPGLAQWVHAIDLIPRYCGAWLPQYRGIKQDSAGNEFELGRTAITKFDLPRGESNLVMALYHLLSNLGPE